MKMFSVRLLSGFVVLLATALGAAEKAAPAKWQNDYLQVRKEAAAKKKPILLFFTGSDWCPPCMKMAKETWSNEQVIGYVNKHFVPLLVDMPRRKLLTQEEAKRNQQLAGKYKLQYVPTIVVADAEGKEKGRTGFNLPEDFLKFLKKF